ncbi:hypothetical protein [Vibrio owensii]|uniref:hypothetical protein n=1 Tax=Vibrio owensii TaxID=696485 RepID=UPI0018F186C0|nr:hypothetical protein [Vibrio owensii]
MAKNKLKKIEVSDTNLTGRKGNEIATALTTISEHIKQFGFIYKQGETLIHRLQKFEVRSWVTADERNTSLFFKGIPIGQSRIEGNRLNVHFIDEQVIKNVAKHIKSMR